MVHTERNHHYEKDEAALHIAALFLAAMMLLTACGSGSPTVFRVSLAGDSLARETIWGCGSQIHPLPADMKKHDAAVGAMPLYSINNLGRIEVNTGEHESDNP